MLTVAVVAVLPLLVLAEIEKTVPNKDPIAIDRSIKGQWNQDQDLNQSIGFDWIRLNFDLKPGEKQRPERNGFSRIDYKFESKRVLLEEQN